MTREELLQLHDELSFRAKEIMKAKSNDYAFGSDLFANFRGSMFINIPVELGILMRSMDKFKRIETFVRSGNLQVKNESVEDAILDVINYMILLAGIITENKQKESILLLNKMQLKKIDNIFKCGRCGEGFINNEAVYIDKEIGYVHSNEYCRSKQDNL